MIRYAVSFSLAFAVAIAAVASANYAVDADRIYGARNAIDRFAAGYVDRLVSTEGGLVIGSQERSIKLELARRSHADCLVTGSSHEMQLDRESAPLIFGGCRSVLNLGVPSGAFEDFIAAVGVILRRNAAGTIYVGINLWSLRRNFSPRFAEERKAYDEGRAVLGLDNDAAGHAEGLPWYVNLVSADYLQHNLAALRRAMRRDEGSYWRRFAIRDGRSAMDDERVIAPNGTIRYSRNMVARPPQLMPNQLAGPLFAQVALDREVAREFEQVLTVLVRRGMTVKIVLMPFHPALMSCTYAHVCEMFSSVEGHARDLGRRRGIEVIGSFDPRPLGLTSVDFVDRGHMRIEALRKVGPLSYNPWTARGG